MKTIINILLISFSTWAAHADFVFDDFSSLTYSPTTMGTLTNSGFVLTITGDDGSFFSDSNNGSTNAMTLGNKLPATQIESLTLGFSTPVSALRLDLDAMHEVQGDSITTSGGVWISFPATLNLSGKTLSSTAPVINPGGSGVDDNLTAVLTFGVPVSSVTFTSTGAFGLDTITAIVPDPSSSALLLTGALMVLAVWGCRKQNAA
jgi:hypothetical protein